MPELTISFDDSQAVNLEYTTVTLSAPTGLTATPVVGGGTFAAGNYFWEVTATTALGETTVSNEATAAIALNGSAQLAWNAVNGVVSNYKIYRGTAAGAENTLVATVAGNVTSFLDTDVGAAGAPPAANTAIVQDTTLITGFCYFVGYSLRESTGTAAAQVEIQDNTGVIAEIELDQSKSDTQGTFGAGSAINGFIKMHVIKGQVTGVIYARIEPVC